MRSCFTSITLHMLLHTTHVIARDSILILENERQQSASSASLTTRHSVRRIQTQTDRQTERYGYKRSA